MTHGKEHLDQMSIYLLRIIAREVGVKAPTSLKKAELIEEILQIQSGKKKPSVPTKKGRPVKSHDVDTNIEKVKNIINEPVNITKKQIKSILIASILSEIEKKLNEIL